MRPGCTPPHHTVGSGRREGGRQGEPVAVEVVRQVVVMAVILMVRVVVAVVVVSGGAWIRRKHSGHLRHVWD